MIATDVASRGIDFPQISYVINREMPRSIEDYVHRVGRTGRGGNSGTAITIIKDSEGATKDLLKLLQKNKQAVPDWFKDIISDSNQERTDKRNNNNTRTRGNNNFGNNQSRQGNNYGAQGGDRERKNFRSNQDNHDWIEESNRNQDKLFRDIENEEINPKESFTTNNNKNNNRQNKKHDETPKNYSKDNGKKSIFDDDTAETRNKESNFHPKKKNIFDDDDIANLFDKKI